MNNDDNEFSSRHSIFNSRDNSFFDEFDGASSSRYATPFELDEDVHQRAFTLSDVEKPNLQTWLKHSVYFLLTFITTTIAGLLPPLGNSVLPPDNILSFGNWLDYVFIFTRLYATIFQNIYLALAENPHLLWNGLMFSASLMTILTAHEFGHYIACRIYKVDATLPFFIPTPPLVGPAGTLGAFIQIRSPLPSKTATFDIGVAGPIAGFIALLPIAFIGVATMQPSSEAFSNGISFSPPLLTILIGKLVGVDPTTSAMNPFYAAAWVGLLVTGLNLIPVGQLDGGHAVFAVFGEEIHQWIGRIAFVLMAITAICGFIYFNSPSGFLFAILLGFMLRIKHPSPLDETPLDWKRILIALLTFAIFILSFSPFPIRVSLE